MDSVNKHTFDYGEVEASDEQLRDFALDLLSYWYGAPEHAELNGGDFIEALGFSMDRHFENRQYIDETS